MQLIYSCGIDKRLESRTHLSASLFYMIVLKVFVVHTANPRFYMTGLGIHRHHARMQKRFVITHGIHRFHNGVYVTFPCKFGHLCGPVEGSVNVFFIHLYIVFHVSRPFTLSHRTLPKGISFRLILFQNWCSWISVGCLLMVKFCLKFWHLLLYGI